MPYFVYILRSAQNDLYIGQTNNLSTRINHHLFKNVKAAKFTKDHNDFKLVYSEQYSTRLEAMQREKQLKRWRREKKEALIEGNLDKLKNLSKKRR